MPESTVPALSPDAPLIPIVLGVVGHRDIHPGAVSEVRMALKKVFDEFDEAYPHSPKVLLSPLAPGADQLAAEVALARGEQWKVRAPLAFHPDVFLESTSFRCNSLKTPENPDGVDTAGQKQFVALCEDDRVSWFVVPLPAGLTMGGRAICQRGAAWFIAPPIAGTTDEQLDWGLVAGGRPGEPSEHAALRRVCYANPGGYIVRHCHTLIALWDEKHVTRPSGTAESVRFQVGGLSPAFYPSASDAPLGFDTDRGPVIVIHAPRAADPDDAEAGKRSVLVPSRLNGLYFGEKVDVPKVARKVTQSERFGKRLGRTFWRGPRFAPDPAGAVLRPGPWRPDVPRTVSLEYDQFLTICQTIDDFNREALGLYQADPLNQDFQIRLDQADLAVVAAFPTTDPDSGIDLKQPLGYWYRRILRVRAAAAHLAGTLTPRHDFAVFSLFLLLFVAVGLFHLYAHPVWDLDHAKRVEHPSALLALYLGVWVGMAVWVGRLWWIRLDDRRHDYRALAEALRVRQAYAMAGVGRSVADTYLSQQRTELAWVRRALQHLCPPSEFWNIQFSRLSTSRKHERIQQVEQDWVRQQEAHYERRKGEEHNMAVRYRVRGFGLALAGLLILAVLPWFGPGWSLVAGLLVTDYQQARVPDKDVGIRPPDDLKAQHTTDAVEPPHPAGGNAVDPTGGSDVDPANHLGLWLHPSQPLNVLLVIGTMTTILGGLYVALNERRSHEQLAKQYDHMHGVFRAGARELAVILEPASQWPGGSALAQEVDFDRARRVVEELGREALQESALWLMLCRSKPLELPLGA